MKTASLLYTNGAFEKSNKEDLINPNNCQLIIGFGEKNILGNENTYTIIKEKFPNAHIALCSTAGEIFDNEVHDDTMVLTAIELEKTNIQTASVNIDLYNSSYEAGEALVKKLDQKDLKYIFILSDGSKVNGSELVRGIESSILHKIPVTGGLAGDGDKFQSTLVGLNETPKSGNILVVGFYGDAIKIGHGSMGGWEMFGLEKRITKSTANELFEIDNVNALEVYKEYLGIYAKELPKSALLFPLSIKLNDDAEPIIRTILSIDEEKESMIFAGDVPMGSKVRFMKSNFDKLISAASDAANNTLSSIDKGQPQLAILISCVGRKLILNKRTAEEVEAVIDVLGKDVIKTGFYSYGEISPLKPNAKCELHNQTMTITTFEEV